MFSFLISLHNFSVLSHSHVLCNYLKYSSCLFTSEGGRKLVMFNKESILVHKNLSRSMKDKRDRVHFSKRADDLNFFLECGGTMCSTFPDNWAWHEPMMQYNNVPCLCPTGATSLEIELLFLRCVLMGG